MIKKVLAFVQNISFFIVEFNLKLFVCMVANPGHQREGNRYFSRLSNPYEKGSKDGFRTNQY